ncbi:hypothetical protein A6R68_10423, partial [Neotoma lepida]
MELNRSFLAAGCHTLIEVGDELHTFYEKHMATEAAADALGGERKGWLRPKRASRIQKSSHSKEDDICQHGLTKPLKSVRSSGPKHPRLSVSLLHVSCNRNLDALLWRSNVLRKTEEAAEYAKLLAKRMKETKGKRQEQVARRQCSKPLDTIWR